MTPKKLLIASAATLLASCSDMCANTIVTTLDAPDGQHSAILFQRDCGATTIFSTQVAILAKGEPLDGIGNVFVADDGHGLATDGPWGGPWADVRWTAADRVLVRYAPSSRVFKQRPEVDGVTVSYSVHPAPAIGRP